MATEPGDDVGTAELATDRINDADVSAAHDAEAAAEEFEALADGHRYRIAREIVEDCMTRRKRDEIVEALVDVVIANPDVISDAEIAARKEIEKNEEGQG